MAPAKPRGPVEDSRSEASSTKEKPTHPAITALNGKTRRIGIGNSSSPKESASDLAASASAISAVTGAGQEGNTGIQWTALDRSILHGYRHAHRLATTSAFRNPYNQLLLSRPGVGRASPTMARKKERRRQSKEQLATAVRKHFNGMGINENDAVVQFLYTVKHQDKAFRLRFDPQRPR